MTMVNLSHVQEHTLPPFMILRGRAYYVHTAMPDRIAERASEKNRSVGFRYLSDLMMSWTQDEDGHGRGQRVRRCQLDRETWEKQEYGRLTTNGGVYVWDLGMVS
jgi:hypothetical protein